jgi:peptide chain release factor 1
MSWQRKLEKVLERYEELKRLLSDGEISAASPEFVKLSKEYADLTAIAEKIEENQKSVKNFAEAEAMLADTSLDAEMRAMAEEEMYALKEQIPLQDLAIRVMLLPKDEVDERNAIIEFRAGAGGDEAALFAANLFRMYQRYAERQGWKFEVLNYTDTGIGGLRDASAQINGKSVFAKLKFESGVHRVQRVPDTEANGRIHTSTATVAVLPEAEEVDIEILEKDLRIDVFRSGGPGGQSVNTTDSAVRITHIPSGLVVQQQDEKSQHKNKAKALRVLRARLYDQKLAAIDAARSADRRGQVGTGDRSERIRTFNYPQGRITDHRINLTLYKLDRVLEGELDELIEALIAEDQAAKLSQGDDE